MSVTIRDGIRVEWNSIIGMGAIVTRNVPENLTVIGIPVKQ